MAARSRGRETARRSRGASRPARRRAGRAPVGHQRPERARGRAVNPKLWVLAVALAVIARARVAVLPGWIGPLPALLVAAEITVCVTVIAWLILRARHHAPSPVPAGGPS